VEVGKGRRVGCLLALLAEEEWSMSKLFKVMKIVTIKEELDLTSLDVDGAACRLKELSPGPPAGSEEASSELARRIRGSFLQPRRPAVASAGSGGEAGRGEGWWMLSWQSSQGRTWTWGGCTR